MALKLEKDVEKNRKNEPGSTAFWLLWLVGAAIIVFLVVTLLYLYSSLMESRENISVLQNKMSSVEKLCAQLAWYAVKLRQQEGNLFRADQRVTDPQSYVGNENRELEQDSSLPVTEFIEQYLYNSSAVNNFNLSADDPFAYNVSTAVNASRSGFMEEGADGSDLDFCNQVDLEDFKKHCRELHSQHGRVKRSNQRGKHKGRKAPAAGRRRPQRHRDLGPVATHFKGGLPETFIRDTGTSLVAPWYPDSRASADFTLTYEFREGKGVVEVAENGLYLIYAQVYYLTNHSLNTYVVNIREKDAEATPAAFCSSNAMVPPNGGITEVSCFTSVVRYLNATTEVFLMQRDRNRRMILREGHTFLGLVRLNKRPEPKRRRGNHN